jgi:hypothetical protein
MNLIFRVGILALFMALGSAQAGELIKSGDLIEQRLQAASNWLNAVINSRAGHASKLIDTAILPVDIPNYLQYVASAYGENMYPELGKPALSAYLQNNTLVNQRPMDTCFMLYNRDTSSELESQFIAPHRKTYGESIIPYAFVAAHELGHCIEFQHNSPQKNQSRSSLQLEVSADIFAILLLRQTGVDSAELVEITKSRKNTSSSHSTWKWIQSALENNFSFRNESLIEDLWKTADKLSEQAH